MSHAHTILLGRDVEFGSGGKQRDVHRLTAVSAVRESRGGPAGRRGRYRGDCYEPSGFALDS